MSERVDLNRILTPTDFSDCATGAVLYAKLLASRFGARLTLLHAAPPQPVFEPLPVSGISFFETIEEEQSRAASALESYGAEHLAEFPESDLVLATGGPADSILESSRSLDADIIVMGTHGREGLSRALLGSVAESVIQRSDRPVLTVRPIEHSSRWPRLARILCPVNYSAVAAKAYQHALFLASAFDAELTVLYLAEDAHIDDAIEAKRLRQWVGDVPLTVRATFLVDRGEAAAQVNDYALLHSIDLIVMGVKHTRRDTITVIGSTTATLTRQAPCPVLTVPGDMLAIEESAHALYTHDGQHGRTAAVVQ